MLTGGSMRSFAQVELPGVTFLSAGAEGPQLVQHAVQQEGLDLAGPTPAMEGALFGKIRLQLGLEESLVAARQWAPETVVAESYDAIGPLIAARESVPWFEFGLGPGTTAVNAASIRAAAQPFYEQKNVVYGSPAAYLESSPAALKPDNWSTDLPILKIRTEPFRSLSGQVQLPQLDRDHTRVLVTLGTIFSGEELLEEILRQVVGAGASVLATEGLVLGQGAGAGRIGQTTGAQVVSFAPLAALLEQVDVVVSVGGSGTVFGAAATGTPLVLFPQGADQRPVSAAAAKAGIAVVVSSSAELPEALNLLVGDASYAAAAAAVRLEIESMPSASEVAAQIVAMVGGEARP